MRISRHLRFIFFAAVLLPCAALAFLAVRSIGREEAFLEKRLQGTLDAELDHVVALLQDELRLCGEDLAAAAPAEPGPAAGAALAGWKKASPLVGVPFLLSADFRILWPAAADGLNAAERAFLNWNRDFMTDVKPTPVYQNAALLYKDALTDSAGSDKERAGGGAEKNAAAPTAAPKPDPAASGEAAAARSRLENVRQEQQALAEFEQSDTARKRVYDEAARKGQKMETRTVTPGAGLSPRTAPAARPESVYISEPKRFSEITAGRPSGLVPRFIGDRLSVLFWKRLGSGRLLGCLLDGETLKARLLGRLPALFSPARILTVLDENGRPLATPEGGAKRDWRRPLAAREVSETLPRWEAAAYPTDPAAVAVQARSTRSLLAALIGGLLALAAVAGTVVLRTLQSEMRLARQKTTFVTNVSHELKTPLTSIRLFSEMLKDGRQPDPGKRAAYLGLMAAETERLTRLINNVLDFSRMEKGRRAYDKAALDASRLARESVESERLRLEHDGFRVDFIDTAGPVVVEADGEAVRQALLNLLSNAEKYGAAGKSIEVEVGRAEGRVFIDVKDRGPGIPAAEAGRIFKEFYRVDRSLTARVPGSGLGLTIARRIARDHGGDVVYRPRQGGGALFRLTLPEAGRP